MSSPTRRTALVAALVLAAGLVLSLVFDYVAMEQLVRGDTEQLRAYPLLTVAISAANGIKLIGAVMVGMTLRDRYRDRPGARATGTVLAVAGGAVFLALASVSLSGVWFAADPGGQMVVATIVQIVSTMAAAVAAAGVMLVLTHDQDVTPERRSVWPDPPGT